MISPYTTMSEFLDDGGVIENQESVTGFVLISEVRSGSCPEIIVRTYQIKDDKENTSECEQTITVDDKTAPDIGGLNSLIVYDRNEIPKAYTYVKEFEAAGGYVNDNNTIDEGSFLLLEENRRMVNGKEQIYRTYQVADSCGNANQCMHEIICSDTIAPKLTSPETLVVESRADVPKAFSTLDEFLSGGGKIDETTGIHIFELLTETSSGNCPEMIERTYQITDSCMNKSACIHSIVIDDQTAPLVTGGKELFVDESSDIPAAYVTLDDFITGGFSVSDNNQLDESSFKLLTEESKTNDGILTVTRSYQIADQCGNETVAEHSITRLNANALVMSAPDDFSVSCEADVPAAYHSYVEFTAAGGVVKSDCTLENSTFHLINTTTSGSDCSLSLTRTYQISNSCALSATSQQKIVIKDETPPILVCPEGSVVENDLSEMAAYQNLEEFIAAGGEASDNCSLDESGFVLLSEDIDYSVYPIVVTRIYQIFDDCGNSTTAKQYLKLVDTKPPLIGWSNSLKVASIEEAPVYFTIEEFIKDGGVVSDNLGIDSISFSLSDEDITSNPCPASVVRTYSVADIGGNITTYNHEIFVDDTMGPKVTFMGESVVNSLDEAPLAYLSIADISDEEILIQDNVQIDESSLMLLSEEIDTVSSPNTLKRTYSLADICGNLTSFTHVIFIDSAIGIDGLNPLENLNCIVYPNPNRGQFAIEFDSSNDIDLNIHLISSLGTVIDQRQVQLNSFKRKEEFNLHNLPGGVYHLVMYNGTNHISKSIIIQR